MKIHRFYIENLQNTELINIKDKDLISQIRNVLKLKIGEIVIVFNNLLEIECKILEINKSNIQLNTIKIDKIKTKKDNITLSFSLLKNENTELVLQKATEIGVGRIIPIITDRTIKKGFNRTRYEKIIKEAVEQSGQTNIPILEDPKSLLEVFKENKGYKFIFLHQNGIDKVTIKDKNKTIILIGPEGGWSDKELQNAKDNGAYIVSLGKTTLRAETASIIASYLYK